MAAHNAAPVVPIRMFPGSAGNLVENGHQRHYLIHISGKRGGRILAAQIIPVQSAPLAHIVFLAELAAIHVDKLVQWAFRVSSSNRNLQRDIRFRLLGAISRGEPPTIR